VRAQILQRDSVDCRLRQLQFIGVPPLRDRASPREIAPALLKSGEGMTPDQIRELVRLSYAAYDRGDRSFALNLFHDDIEWTFYCPPEALPVPNRVKGKSAVLAALKRIDEVIEIVRDEIDVVVADEDLAAVICDRAVRIRANGRVMRYKVAAFHRYQDGRLIEYISFVDGFDLLQQTLGREIPVERGYSS
jgi:ketosteroid isomerase-like protein